MVDNSLIKNLPELFVPFQEAAYLCLINIWLFGKTDVVWSDVYVQFDHVDIGCLLNFYDISSEFRSYLWHCLIFYLAGARNLVRQAELIADATC